MHILVPASATVLYSVVQAGLLRGCCVGFDVSIQTVPGPVPVDLSMPEAILFPCLARDVYLSAQSTLLDSQQK